MQELLTHSTQNWPEILRKLAFNSAQRRHDLAEDHRIECKNLFEFGQREYYRLVSQENAQPFLSAGRICIYQLKT